MMKRVCDVITCRSEAENVKGDTSFRAFCLDLCPKHRDEFLRDVLAYNRAREALDRTLEKKWTA